MKRYGILTFQFADNYGAQLQAYALKKFISENCGQAEIINYAGLDLWEGYKLWHKVNNVKGLLRNIKSVLLRHKQYRLFKDFSLRYLGIERKTAFQDRDLISNNYEAIVVGSDQVWNVDLTYNDSVYFLDGIECKRKISYAASLGKNDSVKKLDEGKLTALKQFEAIAVRESEVTNVLAAVLDKQVLCTVDPVFLFDRNQWISLERKAKGIEKNYICLVLLRHDPLLIEECKKLERKTGYKTIAIHPFGRKQGYGSQLTNIGPLEFIWMIHHAECVVTNSFHAAAFSIIMDRKIIYNALENGNNRISSMMKLIGVDEGELRLIDTSLCERTKLQKQIDDSKLFLLNNLSVDVF